MFKKIRRNFIISAMLSVSVILLISILTINIVNYKNADNVCDNIIKEINEKPQPPTPTNEPPKPGDIGDNSYFIAIYENNDFTIKDEDFKMRAISKDEAKNIAITVKKSGKTIGYYNYYRYNVFNTKYIFLDATNIRNSADNFLKISIYASLGGLAAFFILIFFASSRVLKPVKESYDKQRQFITNASHELKTPLTIISANNELLEINGIKNEQTENITNQVDRLNKLIRNLINFSKMSEKKILEKTEFDISSMLTDLANNYKIVCDDLNINIHLDIESNIKIKSNKETIFQMFSIVMDNARKYAVKNINLSLKNNKNSIEFKESNDTSGIDDGDLSFYTERFYRTDVSRTKNEGSGIGLSILKELANSTKTKLKLYGENNNFNIVLIFKKNQKIISKKDNSKISENN